MFARVLLLVPALWAGLVMAFPVAAEEATEAAVPADSAAVVVMYHRFGEGALPATSIRLEQVEEHIAVLTEGRHTVLPLAEVVDALRAGRSLPPRTVAITVDDAYLSFVTEGWPRFKAAGLPVTWFVNTQTVDAGFSGAPTWDDLRRLRDEGVDFGVHMHAHPSMPGLTPAGQAADLDIALERFETELDLRPALFAYPYGEADAHSLALVRERGFLAAFGQQSGVAWGGDDLFNLPRFSLNERWGESDRFRRVLDALPLTAVDVTPADPTIRPPRDANPPHYGFTVVDPDLDLSALACYGPGGALDVERLGQRVEVRFAEPLRPGRARINCTLPGPRESDADGGQRWHWRGFQVLVLPQTAQ